MSALKNDPNVNLFYSDTDSVVTDTPLPPKYLGNKLGQFKQEHVITKAIFLAPKVYCLVTEEGKLIIKAKGIIQSEVNKLTYKDFLNLLIKDASPYGYFVEINQEKWHKKLMEGNISIRDTLYTLKATSSKRIPIYKTINSDGLPGMKSGRDRNIFKY